MATHVFAQIHAGAGAGWTHSKAHAQGGPLVSMLVERRRPLSATRIVLDAQIPSTAQTNFTDNGSGRMLSAGQWSDGHMRAVMTSTTLSMVSVAADHLFLIDTDRPEDRIDMRLGPGIAWASEDVRYDHRVADITADTTEFYRFDRSRGAWNIRITLGAAYRLPLGELLVEATTELLTFDGRRQGFGGSAWLQRQLFRVAAVFPIGAKE